MTPALVVEATAVAAAAAVRGEQRAGPRAEQAAAARAAETAEAAEAAEAGRAALEASAG